MLEINKMWTEKIEWHWEQNKWHHTMSCPINQTKSYHDRRSAQTTFVMDQQLAQETKTTPRRMEFLRKDWELLRSYNFWNSGGWEGKEGKQGRKLEKRGKWGNRQISEECMNSQTVSNILNSIRLQRGGGIDGGRGRGVWWGLKLGYLGLLNILFCRSELFIVWQQLFQRF